MKRLELVPSVTAPKIEDLAQFLTSEALAFTEARFDDLLAFLDTPTSVYVFTSMLMVNDLNTAKSLLGVFHGNLLNAGFSETKTEVTDTIREGEDKARLNTHTTFFAADGEALLKVHVTYFCVFSKSKGSWRVTMLEVMNQPNGQFIKGIDLI